MDSDLKFFYSIILSATLGFLAGSFVSNLQGNHLQYGMELQKYVDERISEMEAYHNKIYERLDEVHTENTLIREEMTTE